MEVSEGDLFVKSCITFENGCPTEHFKNTDFYKCMCVLHRYWRYILEENDFLKYFSFMFDLSVHSCQLIDTIHNCYRSNPTCQGKKMNFRDEVDGNRNLPRDFFIFLIYFGILFLLFIVVLYFLRRKTVKKSTTRKACSTVSNQQWIKHKFNRSQNYINYSIRTLTNPLLLQYTYTWICVFTEGRIKGGQKLTNSQSKNHWSGEPSRKEPVSSVQYQRTKNEFIWHIINLIMLMDIFYFSLTQDFRCL